MSTVLFLGYSAMACVVVGMIGYFMGYKDGYRWAQVEQMRMSDFLGNLPARSEDKP